jgi:hypothetical protein
MRILGKHPSYDSLKLFRIAGRDTVKCACLDFHGKTEMVLRLKRWSECCQFVNDAPERPNVTLLVVFGVIDLLWAHIVRGANMSVRELRLSIHHSGQAKVSYLDVAVCIEEYIPRFKVSVENFQTA